MTIYYVDSAVGNDTNSGLTPALAFLTIQKGHDVSNPGDTIYIMPGKGYGGGATNTPVLTVSRSGSATGGYITYSGYPGLPMPIINGITGTGTGGSQVIQIGSGFGGLTSDTIVSYIIFQNLELFGGNGALTAQGAWNDFTASTGTSQYNIIGVTCGVGNGTINTSAGSSSTTLTFASSPITAGVISGDVVIDTTSTGRIPKGTTVVGTSSTTVTLSAAASGVVNGDTIRFVHPKHHIQFLNCKIHDFSGGGIALLYTDYITISGCLVYNNAWFAPNAQSGLTPLYKAVDIDTNTATYKNVFSNNIMFNNANLVPYNQNTRQTGFTANGGPQNGTTLALNQTPTSVVAGMGVMDTTSAGRVLAGTYVVSKSGNNVTVSQNLNGVVASDAIAFQAFSDGEGILIDDTAGDQSPSTVPYQGKTLITNNLAVLNGSTGIQVFNSANVDVTFNTCYLNNQHPAYSFSLAQAGDISYQGGQPTNGNCFNNVVQCNAGNPALANTGSGAATFGNNLSFGNGTALPGSNNVTNQNPLFVSTPTTTVSYGANGITVTNAGTITSLVPATVGISSSPNPPFPSFTNFNLQAGSPAIDAGTASFTRTTDFLGNAGQFGPAYDMGAYESPCSPWSGNPIQSMSTLMTLLADNTTGQILPLQLREAVVTVWAGRHSAS